MPLTWVFNLSFSQTHPIKKHRGSFLLFLCRNGTGLEARKGFDTVARPQVVPDFFFVFYCNRALRIGRCDLVTAET
jgi:hypothetical protein